ncbi:MAG: nuclear transport factor 2 family protein [bacterium]
MRRKLIVLGAILLGSWGLAAASGVQQAEEEAVRETVMTAYVDGIHNYRRVEDVREGFHPDFRMLMLREGTLGELAIGDWIAALERQNRQSGPVPGDAAPTTRPEFVQIDITGDAASVKLELYREGKKVFTDYLLLYRFPGEGWRIVSKTFYRHP